jgi:hypothetical protein
MVRKHLPRLLQIPPLALVVCYAPTLLIAQCHFVAEPADTITWHRPKGWDIPGLKDATFVRPRREVNGVPKPWSLPEGISLSVAVFREGYHVTFPAAVFEQDGKPMKMAARSFGIHQIVRWEIHGQPYAYSYLLLPDDVACSFTVDLVDDIGDGVFRSLVTPGHFIFSNPLVPPPLPEWASKRPS